MAPAKAKLLLWTFAPELGANDAVRIWIHLVQHHSQQSSVGLAVALLANQLYSTAPTQTSNESVG